MLRRVLVAGSLVLALAACGGSSPTPSPESSAAPPTEMPVETIAPEPSAMPSAAPAATTATAACDSVSLRKSPGTTGQVVGRVYRGTKVRVVETVTGDAYTAGNCGSSGDSWYRIDKVGGKSVKKLYGVDAVYSAAGFYK